MLFASAQAVNSPAQQKTLISWDFSVPCWAPEMHVFFQLHFHLPAKSILANMKF